MNKSGEVRHPCSIVLAQVRTRKVDRQWTHGRTKVSRSFAIETLVSTRARHPAEMARLRLEHRAPAELCLRTRSVGEVAAILSVPLGVACVLIDEMADLGIVVVHTRSALDGPPELELLRRVRDGLQRL
jgi:hypothetical protein